MSKQQCWLCKHFSYDEGFRGTDVTPGDAPEMRCLKRHWHFRPYRDYEDTFRKCFEKGKDCKDYEHHKGE